MKRSTILACSLLLPVLLTAQGRIYEIWTEPAAFMADEAVSVFFDVSGTVLDGISESEGVCVWTWFPSSPADAWGNPTDKTKLKHVEGNIWRWDLVPTELYNKPAGEINEFYGQLQNHAGTKITEAFAPDQNPPNQVIRYSLDYVKGNSAILDFYPKQFRTSRPLSILLNTNHTWSDCESTPTQGKLAGASNVHMHGGLNNWNPLVENNPQNQSKTALTDMGDGIWRMDLILQDYFGFDDNFVLQGINMVFANSDWSLMGKDINCADFYIEAPEMAELPVPELILFPQKIGRRDILILIRKNNEPWVSALNYTITAGSKTLSGSFSGSSKEMTAYIDLATELKDMEALEKIHLRITGPSGNVISETDIPLVQQTK